MNYLEHLLELSDRSATTSYSFADGQTQPAENYYIESHQQLGYHSKAQLSLSSDFVNFWYLPLVADIQMGDPQSKNS